MSGGGAKVCRRLRNVYLGPDSLSFLLCLLFRQFLVALVHSDYWNAQQLFMFNIHNWTVPSHLKNVQYTLAMFSGSKAFL